MGHRFDLIEFYFLQASSVYEKDLSTFKRTSFNKKEIQRSSKKIKYG
jgi:hypothetical protein